MSDQRNNIVTLCVSSRELEPDKRLLQLFLQGNAKAFDQFYERHATKMLAFTKRLLNYHTSNAEDVHASVWEKFLVLLFDKDNGQELFLDKIFNTNKNKSGSAIPYLQIMIRNKVIDLYRSASRKKEDSIEIEERDDASSELKTIDIADSSAAEESEARELATYVYQSIQQPVLKIAVSLSNASYDIDRKRLEKLKDKAEKKANILKRIFDLRMEGFNYTDIACEIGIDRKTLGKIRTDYNKLLGSYFVEKGYCIKE